MIEKLISTTVQSNPAVAAIATGGGGFLAQLPENQVLPSWTYTFAGGRTEHTLSGLRGPRYRRLQIDCFGNGAADVIALGEAIDAVLENFLGNFPDNTFSPPIYTTIFSCLMEGEPVDHFDSVRRTWRRMIEYEICFQQ